jgi:hypothetical protein
MDQQAMNNAMREAVSNALAGLTAGDAHEQAVDAAIEAVKERLVEDLPAIMLHAAQQPATQQQLFTALVVPLLHEIEDTLNDDQNDSKVHASYLPGLRRAASYIREIRRAVAAGDTPA